MLPCEQMDQPRKTSFRFLSRSGTDRPSHRGFTRTSISPSLALWPASTEISADEKGPLGLTTLHEPPAPTNTVADIVFVHGLGGGSRKTWSFSTDPGHYWPQAWLPADPDFGGVRIHTFGYNADWGERKQSILDIHGFSQTLLGVLRNHSGIRRSATRIILVGHSMGGCVAKKVYILARQDPTASDFARRIHSMFFLATPHRGADLAVVLANMLAVGWGKKPFVTDLTPNSAALSAINDSFRHYAPDLCLWSFYETLPIRGGGVMNRIVVEPHSATLGYPNEQVAYMNADHRQVCKFATPSDPNYSMLRNALLTAVDAIRSSRLVHPLGPGPGQGTDFPSVRDSSLHQKGHLSPANAIALLQSFLATRTSFEDDLSTFQALKQPGTCEWFTNTPQFQAWTAGQRPGMLWLTGRPATGKSVIACHVIEGLISLDVFCSYFICKNSKTGDSTISDIFRSLAFQMALQDDLVRDALVQVADDDVDWDKHDDSSVWRRLFVKCIFKVPSITRHCWVLDGIDECVGYTTLFTKRFLATIPDALRLFATSRGLEVIERGLTVLGPQRVNIYAVSDSDTANDMRLFLTTKLAELGRPEDIRDREHMCESMLSKSKGSFLWARLVIQQFEDAWTEEAMHAILDEIPPDLFELYSHMAQSIIADNRKTTLARSILTWITLSARPLVLDELRCAVKLDVGQTLQHLGKAIPELCAQLVYIDKDNRAYLIHETVREFLLQQDTDFALAVDKKNGHMAVASLLLKYLSSGVLKPQHRTLSSNRRGRGFYNPATPVPSLDLSLMSYATRFFSEHISRATSPNDCLMGSLCDFLQNNTVLEWIEHVALGGDLAPLARTATNLREYLGRQTNYAAPACPPIQTVDKWITDLILVAAKFRTHLLTSASSIHCLIPPLCPTDSLIWRSFAKDTRPSAASGSALAVRGLLSGSWDDCLTRIDFQKGQTSALGHGDRFFAIGLSNGQISLYDPDSLQCLRQMAHPGRVNILEFSPDDLFLASCSSKRLIVWEPKAGAMIYSFPIRSPPLCLTFLGADELLCAFQSCKLTKITLASGEQETRSWEQTDWYDHHVPWGLPGRASFLVTLDDVLMAVGYRGHPVLVWNALELRLLGSCDTGTGNNGICDLVFNPNPEIPVLVVSYQVGTLAVFDYITMELQSERPCVFAYSLACSPDGKNLLAGTNQGVLEGFEFKVSNKGVTTLAPLYRTNHPLDHTIRGVAFSGDGLRFVDIRGPQARVWAPAALVHRNMGESESQTGNSHPDSDSLTPHGFAASISMITVCGGPEISTPLVTTTDGSVIVAGRGNGEVALFARCDGRQIGVLYKHEGGCRVLSVTISNSGKIFASADDAARVLVVRLDEPLDEGNASSQLGKAHICLKFSLDGAVCQLLLNPTADRILVIGRHTGELREIETANFLRQPWPAVGAGWPSFRSVFQHPDKPEWFVVVADDHARIFSWVDLSDLTAHTSGIVFNRPVDTEPSTPTADATATYHVGPGYVVELFRPSRISSTSLHLWLASSLLPQPVPDPTALPITPAAEPNLTAISTNVLSVIGLAGPSTLLFLDVNLWVCSVELQTVTIQAAQPPRPAIINTSQSSTSVIHNNRPGPTPTSSAHHSSRSAAGSVIVPASLPMSPSPSSPSSAAQVHGQAKRHFFALSEWRTEMGLLRCAVVGSGGVATKRSGVSVAFVNGHGVVIISGGLEFSEDVIVAEGHGTTGGGSSPMPSKAAGQDVWTVLGGSMHRRASNW